LLPTVYTFDIVLHDSGNKQTILKAITHKSNQLSVEIGINENS